MRNFCRYVTAILCVLIWTSVAQADNIMIDGEDYQIGGLLCEYWDGDNFNEKKWVGIKDLTPFRLEGAFPDAILGEDVFSIRWMGKLKVTKDDTYTFSAVFDDGLRIWIDGELLINSWKTIPSTQLVEKKEANKYLLAGYHDIRIEYFEDYGKAELDIKWKSSDELKPGNIPADVLVYPVKRDILTQEKIKLRFCELEYLQFYMPPGNAMIDLRTYLQAATESNLGFIEKDGNVVIKDQVLPGGSVSHVGRPDHSLRGEERNGGTYDIQSLCGFKSQVMWNLYETDTPYIEMIYPIDSLDIIRDQDKASCTPAECDVNPEDLFTLSPWYNFRFDLKQKANIPDANDYADVSIDFRPKVLRLNEDNLIEITIKAKNKTLEKFQTAIAIPAKIENQPVEVLSYPEGFEERKQKSGNAVTATMIYKDGDYTGDEAFVIMIHPKEKKSIRTSFIKVGGQTNTQIGLSAEAVAVAGLDEITRKDPKTFVSYHCLFSFQVKEGDNVPVAQVKKEEKRCFYTGLLISDEKKMVVLKQDNVAEKNYFSLGAACLDSAEQGLDGTVTAKDPLCGEVISFVVEAGEIEEVKPADAVLGIKKDIMDSFVFYSRDYFDEYTETNKGIKNISIEKYQKKIDKESQGLVTKCAFCTKLLPQSDRSYFSVYTTKGQRYQTCCASCGYILMAKLKSDVVSAVCFDYYSGQLIDAQKATILITEGLHLCCMPSVLVFADEQKAQMFQKKYGGVIMHIADDIMDDIVSTIRSMQIK